MHVTCSKQGANGWPQRTRVQTNAGYLANTTWPLQPTQSGQAVASRRIQINAGYLAKAAWPLRPMQTSHRRGKSGPANANGQALASKAMHINPGYLANATWPIAHINILHSTNNAKGFLCFMLMPWMLILSAVVAATAKHNDKIPRS